MALESLEEFFGGNIKASVIVHYIFYGFVACEQFFVLFLLFRQVSYFNIQHPIGNIC